MDQKLYILKINFRINLIQFSKKYFNPFWRNGQKIRKISFINENKNIYIYILKLDLIILNILKKNLSRF